MISFIRFIFCFILVNTFAQKQVIDHNAYARWNRIEKVKLSNQGAWLTFEVLPMKGDGYLHWQHVSSGAKDSMFAAKELQMNESGSLMAWRRTPGYDTLRTCELNKIDKKKWPKDTLVIFNSTKDSLRKVSQVKRFEVAESSNYVAYLKEQNDKPKSSTVESPKKCWFHKKEKPTEQVKEIKSDGSTLVLENRNEILFQANNTTDFLLSRQGNLAYITQEKGKRDTSCLWVISPDALLPIKVGNQHFSIKNLQWNKEGTFLAFLYSSDTNKVKQYEMGVYSLLKDSLITFGDLSTTKSFGFKGINDKVQAAFFDYLPYVKFTLSDRIVFQKDTLLESEKVRLDLWSPQDLTLQPQQLLQIKDGDKSGEIVALDLRDFTVKTWCPDSLRGAFNVHRQSNFTLVFDDRPYAIQAQWKSPSLNDVYRLDLRTGEHMLLKKAIAYDGYLSNDGNSFTYFDPIKKNHYLLAIDQGMKEYCMSCAVNEPWEEDLNGQPMDPGPAATYGFNKEGSLYYYGSRDNIYEYDLNLQKNRCLTLDLNNTDWEWIKWNSDSINISWNSGYFQARNRTTKKVSIFTASPSFLLQLVDRGDFKLLSFTQAKDTSVYVLRRMRVDQFPDIEVGGNVSVFKRVSWANPQQSEYLWPSAELIRWKSYQGFDLEGIVYKPENYDPAKKYPLLVYYYELNGDNLHNYRSPAPTASTINPTEYASAGYLVFIPDIRYKPGYPAKGAYDCIMSGTDYMLKKFSIDSTRMGLQGQSWGGYQTAQLITMTNRYKAALAGAPVSNMISAYGGMRWGSGLNRQFQYESSQSRIGATLWERPDLFIENSPLFHLPKVNTPLLVMANDKDGAVPWYQGIELYTGLRRLGKPCWMLNYNDDDHNLTRLPNKMDLSIRMRQFFDFYLNNGPQPLWMKEGIEAREKGKEFKY
ncbi:MAG: prolyl oligopeptidase family serine peptidase [Cryomorphaceae bacterium]|nr:prolyl oligopeptidase family serine peptidase [Cryomorphaceae bacterium]